MIATSGELWNSSGIYINTIQGKRTLGNLLSVHMQVDSVDGTGIVR
jgi:hypothetical protein